MRKQTFSSAFILPWGVDGSSAILTPMTVSVDELPTMPKSMSYLWIIDCLLTKEGMIYYATHYVAGDDDRNHPDVSPLLAVDLCGLPPALMIAAEYDVLKDEGMEYAERLKNAGVPVTYLSYADMIHAFFNLGGEVDRAAAAIDSVCGRLKSILIKPN